MWYLHTRGEVLAVTRNLAHLSKSAVPHDKLRLLVHNSENGFCLGVKVYFVFSRNTAYGFSVFKEETTWSPACEVLLNLGTATEARNGQLPPCGHSCNAFCASRHPH